MSARELKAGDVFVNEYPFVRTTYSYFSPDEEGGYEAPSWKPGTEYAYVSNDGEDCDAVADGVGKQILEVIDIHKPGRFPVRVFYTCKWITPDGKTFGKGGLKITTREAFLRRAAGYMSHDMFFEWSLRSAIQEHSTTPPRNAS